MVATTRLSRQRAQASCQATAAHTQVHHPSSKTPSAVLRETAERLHLAPAAAKAALSLQARANLSPTPRPSTFIITRLSPSFCARSRTGAPRAFRTRLPRSATTTSLKGACESLRRPPSPPIREHLRSPTGLEAPGPRARHAIPHPAPKPEPAFTRLLRAPTHRSTSHSAPNLPRSHPFFHLSTHPPIRHRAPPERNAPHLLRRNPLRLPTPAILNFTEAYMNLRGPRCPHHAPSPGLPSPAPPSEPRDNPPPRPRPNSADPTTPLDRLVGADLDPPSPPASPRRGRHTNYV